MLIKKFLKEKKSKFVYELLSINIIKEHVYDE